MGDVNRIFLPVKKEWFSLYEDGSKTMELRGHYKYFSRKHIYPGRRVEIRCGYNGKSLWGTVGEVTVLNTENDGMPKSFWSKIIPKKAWNKKNIDWLTEYVSKFEEIIVFEIILDKDIPE